MYSLYTVIHPMSIRSHPQGIKYWCLSKKMYRITSMGQQNDQDYNDEISQSLCWALLV